MGNQRFDPDLDQARSHDGGRHRISRRGRHAHPEDHRNHHGKDQGQQRALLCQIKQQAGEPRPHSGERDDPHNQARAGTDDNDLKRHAPAIAKRFVDLTRPHAVGCQPADDSRRRNRQRPRPYDRIAAKKRADQDQDRQEQIGLSHQIRQLGQLVWPHATHTGAAGLEIDHEIDR